MDQPGKVFNPACVELNRENAYFFPLSPFAPENLVYLARRVRPSRPAPAGPFSTLRLNHQSSIWCLLTGFLPRFPTAFTYIYVQYTVLPSTIVGSVPGISGHAIASRWRSLPRVHRHRASSPQGSSSNGRCLFRFHHGPIFHAPLFSHTH